MSTTSTFFKSLGENGDKSLNLLEESCPLPAMVLNREAIMGNSRWMQSFADKAGVKLAPHGKTTMAPELFKIQLDQGAWGMTLANAFQVKVAYHHDVKRILMANQLVGKQNIKDIVELLKQDDSFEFYCCVDNYENVCAISEICEELDLKRPFYILIEVGPKSGRAGVRSIDDVFKLAQRIQLKEPTVKLAGIECYEGVIHGKSAVQEVYAFLESVSSICVELEQAHYFGTDKVFITGGGTVFFDIVSEVLTATPLKKDFDVLIRPGCYLSHDSGLYDEYQNELLTRSELAKSIEGGLSSAIEVYAYIQSMPESGMAILNIGKRDVSFDSGLPQPSRHFDVSEQKLTEVSKAWQLFDLNDQHAFMSFPETEDLQVGDIIILTVSHPCLTFDKWQSIMMRDQQYNIVAHLKTFFG